MADRPVITASVPNPQQWLATLTRRDGRVAAYCTHPECDETSGWVTADKRVTAERRIVAHITKEHLR